LALTFQNISRDAWNKHSISAFGLKIADTAARSPIQNRGKAPSLVPSCLASDAHHFDGDHTRVMTELVGFTCIALRMIQIEERPRLALPAEAPGEPASGSMLVAATIRRIGGEIE
jgi:hypothetical protein